MVNPFLPKGFPIDEYNRPALDRVKSIKVPIRQERVETSSLSSLSSIYSIIVVVTKILSLKTHKNNRIKNTKLVVFNLK